MLTERDEDNMSFTLTKAHAIDTTYQSMPKKYNIKNLSGDFSDPELEEKDNNSLTARNIEIPKLTTNINLNLGDINNNSSKSSRLRKTEFLQIKNTIHLRINFLVNINYFIKNYVYDLNQIFNKIDSIIYRKITNLIDKSKYFIKFFKDIISKFEHFAFSMEESVNSLNFHFREDKYNFKKLNKEIEKTQKLFSTGILEYNKIIQEKLFAKDSLNEKIKNFHSKIGEISKDSFNILSELTKKKEKFCNRYSSFEKTFENFKKDYNSTERIQNILNKNEFYQIEIELSKIVNKIFLLAEKFFIKYIFCLSQLKNVCKDFMSMLLELTENYKISLKSFFNINSNLLEKITMIENDEIINNIFGNKDLFYDKSELKELEDIFKVFQNNIIKFNFINNDVIYFDENFQMEKFKSFEQIVDFFMSILPEKVKFESSNLSFFNCKFNQIKGFFKNERTCIIVITVQDNIIIFDEKYGRKNSQKIVLKNTKFTKIDDNNSPFKFEISELKHGVLFNSVDKYVFDTKKPEDFIEFKEFFINSNNDKTNIN